MVRSLNIYPPNPAYGGGTFRRRVVLSRRGDQLSARLLDDFHTMDLTLHVADGVVSGVAGKMDRFPKTTCPGAVGALDAALRGRSAIGGVAALRGVDRGAQCTHLIDLAMLALSWPECGRDGAQQVIEVALTDRDPAGRQDLTITVDGAAELVCTFVDTVIALPAEYRGRTMFGGFARWANETFPPEQARLWLLAQISLFVADGRAVIVDGPNPLSVAAEPARKGACFSFSDPSFAVAIDNVGYSRDMSAGLPPLAGDAERNTP